MTKALQFKTRRAASGKAASLVVFLHGYGADGTDLLGIGAALAPHLPDTMFAAPDAPEPCRGNPFGFQWFGIPHMDGTPASEMAASLAGSTALLHRFLDHIGAETGVPAGRTVLLGFSQGTMMALHAGLQRIAPLAGIIGFSGRLLDAAGPANARTKPPVLLVHGDADPMVPYASLAVAAQALQAAGIDVQAHTSPGAGHGIAPDGLGLALAFLQRHLAVTRPQ